MKKQKSLLELATAWAAEQQKSKAQTIGGMERAAQAFLDCEIYCAEKNARISRREFRSLEQWYLDYLYTEAEREMECEFRARAAWKENKKAARKLPVFARHFLVSDAPDRVAKKYAKQAGSLLDEVFPREEICKEAFQRAPWGRLRKKYKGKNYIHARIRTETNGKSGWDCVSWHYADYTAIEAPDRRSIYVVYPDKSTELVRVSPSRIFARVGGQIVRCKTDESTASVIRPHHLLRYYSAPLRSLAPIDWQWDRAEGSGYYVETTTGEQYHTEARPVGPALSHYRAAVVAFSKRRAEKIYNERREAGEEYLRLQARNVFVTFDDSVTAGNCPVGTRSEVERLRREYGLAHVAPASLLLKIRDDNFMRRAAVAAAVRTLYSA